MPPVFGPGVAVEGGLVVLRRRQRQDRPAGDQGQEAQLLAVEPLLDDDLPAGGRGRTPRGP